MHWHNVGMRDTCITCQGPLKLYMTKSCKIGKLYVLDVPRQVDVLDSRDGLGSVFRKTTFLLLNGRLVRDTGHEFSHVGVYHHTSHHKLVQDVVHLVHVKHEVKLTDIFKGLIKKLYQDLNQVQDAQLTLAGVGAEYYEQSSIATVDNLVVRIFNEISTFKEAANVICSPGNKLKNLAYNVLLLLFMEMFVEFRQPDLSILVKY